MAVDEDALKRELSVMSREKRQRVMNLKYKDTGYDAGALLGKKLARAPADAAAHGKYRPQRARR